MEAEGLTAVHYFFGGSGLTVGVLVFLAGGLYRAVRLRLDYLEKAVERERVERREQNDRKWSKIDGLVEDLKGIKEKVDFLYGKANGG